MAASIATGESATIPTHDAVAMVHNPNDFSVGMVLSDAFIVGCENDACAHLFLERAELRDEPPEDVVDKRLCHRDLGVLGEPRRLETTVNELARKDFERNPVLESNRYCRSEGVHETRDCGPFLCDGEKDLTGLPVFVEPCGDVALVRVYRELVGDRRSFVGEFVTTIVSFLRRCDGYGLSRCWLCHVDFLHTM